MLGTKSNRSQTSIVTFNPDCDAITSCMPDVCTFLPMYCPGSSVGHNGSRLWNRSILYTRVESRGGGGGRVVIAGAGWDRIRELDRGREQTRERKREEGRE